MMVVFLGPKLVQPWKKGKNYSGSSWIILPGYKKERLRGAAVIGMWKTLR